MKGDAIMPIDNKKEQEREELHRAIWAIADELRGAVDGWDFKNYVLGTMFYRYISENLTAYVNEGEWEAGDETFDYTRMSDEEAEEAREGLVEEKGFFILPSELFCNVHAKCNNEKATFKDREGKIKNIKDNLNELLEMVFQHIEESAQGSESENSFSGLFDDFDVNSNKLGSTVAKRNERLAKLLDGIAAMNLGSVKDHDIDAFGDAYEYLMTMYASNAGKSGGEFFTPADVSELLTRLGTVGKKKVNKVYDPACGSGSLLLRAVKILGKDAVTTGFFGQEINITTYNLCRTTIQKLSTFIKKNKEHPVYNKQVVIIFDECHRSQFGDMHTAIAGGVDKNGNKKSGAFQKYYMFGFTGTPIFSVNANTSSKSMLFTTAQTFGDQLHEYTIVDAINDKNVLPFRVDYIKTMDSDKDIDDEQVWDINREKAFMAPQRISQVTKYILDHFDQKTYRGDKTYIYNQLTNISVICKNVLMQLFPYLEIRTPVASSYCRALKTIITAMSLSMESRCLVM